MDRLGTQEFIARMQANRHPYQDGYLAMYSSLVDGIVTDPALMVLPIDDHMVHRGDAVFETLKCVDGHIYNMGAHLERLQHSAETIMLDSPLSMSALAELIVETCRAADTPKCGIRVLLSRGPGSFGVNPYDCPEPTIYIVITTLSPPFMEKHPDGARMRTSHIPVKPGVFAQIKNCNYLPNVLMARETVDAGVDFVAAFDTNGHLAEGATENIGIVSPDKRLLFPKLDSMLRGTTMVRVMALARDNLIGTVLTGVDATEITKDDIHDAAELLVVGTTRNVIAVVEFDGQPIGTGAPGAVYAELSQLLLDDIAHNPDVRTPVFADA